MRLRTTSTQRTYRYLRLGIAGVVLWLAASLLAEVVASGPLTSVSAAYFTPAQPVFVAGLCAISLALLALSGRSLEQALLDLAALCAPVIALVPTPIERGDVPGYVPGCPGDASCVPVEVVPAVANGMLSLTVIGVVGVLAAVALAIVQRTASRPLIVTIAGAGAVVAATSLWWAIAPGSFLLGAHNVASIAFFALIAAVAGIGALRPAAVDPRRHRGVRAAYATVAGGILLALVFLALVVALRAAGVDLVDASGLPLIFLGEAVALVLFAFFWVVQTIELWDEADPPTVARERGGETDDDGRAPILRGGRE